METLIAANNNYPGTDGMCVEYRGVADAAMVELGIARGHLERAQLASLGGIGVCTTVMRGRECGNTFVVAPGSEVALPDHCPLRPLLGADSALPQQTPEMKSARPV
jgi:hypothetical protein